MTSSDWLTCADPLAMLSLLEGCGDVSERKLRLFLVACCRRVAHINFGDWSEVVAKTCEALTDGPVAPSELVAAVAAVDVVCEVAGGIFTPAEEAFLGLPLEEIGSGPRMTGTHAQETCSATAAAVGYRVVGNDGSEEERHQAAAPERAAQAVLLREIFGELFPPHPFLPEWRTPTVVALTKGIYDAKDFSVMPILADALQDAGCDHEEILNHCRNEKQVHVRGCWVVDLILGKE